MKFASALFALALFAAPTLAIADDVQDALQLLKLSVECGAVDWGETRSGAAYETNRSLSDETHLVVRSSMRNEKYDSNLTTSIPFADITGVTVDEGINSVSIGCRPNCVTMQTDGYDAFQSEAGTIQLCNEKAAQDAKAAIDVLIANAMAKGLR